MAAFPAVQTSLWSPHAPQITDPDLIQLKKRMRGRVVQPSDADYNFLIVDGVFNKLQTNRPSALLQPLGTADSE